VEAWDEFTRGSPVRRSRREGQLRNVAVLAGPCYAAALTIELLGSVDEFLEAAATYDAARYQEQFVCRNRSGEGGSVVRFGLVS
jgi:hypothetical protein